MPLLLVVDDDEAICETLCDLFAGESKGVSTVEEALTCLEAEDYAVLLTDISMPGKSGVELLSFVLEHHPKMPVIIISGINDQAHKEGLMKLGAFDYFNKPFTLEEVEASVNRAITHHFRLMAENRENVHSEKAKYYGLSICATNIKTDEKEHEPRLVVASSIDEAKQKGFEEAHQKWPRMDGWIDHSVVAREEKDMI